MGTTCCPWALSQPPPLPEFSPRWGPWQPGLCTSQSPTAPWDYPPGAQVPWHPA